MKTGKTVRSESLDGSAPSGSRSLVDGQQAIDARRLGPPGRRRLRGISGVAPRGGGGVTEGAVEALGHEVPGRHPDDMAILVIRFLGHRVRPPLAVASREQNRTPDV